MAQAAPVLLLALATSGPTFPGES